MVIANTCQVEMPNHCGNCRWRLWDETGIQCRNHHRLDDDQVVEMNAAYLDGPKELWPELFEVDWSGYGYRGFDGGEIEYSDACAMWEGQRYPGDRVRDWDREPTLTDAEVIAFDARVRAIWNNKK